MLLSTDQVLYVQGGLGRLHKVTAIFIDASNANAYLSLAPTQSVLTVIDPLIFIAESSDLGLPFPLHVPMPDNIRALIESARIFLAEGDVAANRVEADKRLAQALSAINASYQLPIPTSAI